MNVRFSMKLNKLSRLTTLAALVSGFIVHLIASADDVPQNQTYTMLSLPCIDDPKVNSKVTAITMKLAELQRQVLG
ncbi:MAG: hypothetical protein ACI9VT_000052 [Psychroserpens sp.]|jgi:hypothetical protein